MQQEQINKYDPATHFELLQQIYKQQQRIINDIELLKSKQSDYFIDPNRYYNSKEVAEFLGLSVTYVSDRCSNAKNDFIPYSKSSPAMNAPRRFLGEDIKKYLDKNKYKNAADAHEQKRLRAVK